MKVHIVAATICMIVTLMMHKALSDNCGLTSFTGPHGNISSPGYPVYYPNNTDCIYTIQPIDNNYTTFNLTFSELFYLESNGDWVQIDASSCNCNGTYRYTGYILRQPTLSFSGCERLDIQFHADYWTGSEYWGFRITYSLDLATENSTRPCPVDNCGLTRFTGQRGTISSSGYPVVYPYNTNCIYTIEPIDNYTSITLTFSDPFYLDSVGDWILVDASSCNCTGAYRYTGSHLPPTLSFSYCDGLVIQFYSDGLYTGSGFRITYSLDSVTENSTRSCPVDNCGLTRFSGQRDTISSFGYPDAYPQYSDCIYTIEPIDRYKTINLTFSDPFRVEPCCDWVQIDASSCNCNSTYRYTGYLPPPTLTFTDCERLAIQFHSRGFGSDSGFRITYSLDSVTENTTRSCPLDNCGLTSFTGPYGTISSSGYPVAYPYYADCIYTIDLIDNHNTVTLTFSDPFELKSDSTDWVKIDASSCYYCNDSTYRYTGSLRPPTLSFSDCDILVIRFTSGGYLNGAGFRITYYSSDSMTENATRSCPLETFELSSSTIPPTTVDVTSTTSATTITTVGRANSTTRTTMATTTTSTLPTGCESEAIDIGGSHYVRFPSTKFNQTVGSLEKCLPPAGRNPVAMGQCIGDITTKGSWIVVHVNNCTNDTIANGSYSAVTQDLLTLSKGIINTNNVNNVTSQLSNLTSDSSILLPIDIILVANILDNVAYVKKIPTSAGDNFVSVMNNVMNVNDSTLNNAQQMRDTSAILTRALETMTSNVDLASLSNFSSFSTNVAVQVWNMSYTDSNDTGKIGVVGFGYQHQSNSYSTYFQMDVSNVSNISTLHTAIILSPEAIKRAEKIAAEQRNNRDGLRASFIIYQKANLFPQTHDCDSTIEPTNGSNQSLVNSVVVSGAFNGIPIANLTEPVLIYLPRSTKKSYSAQSCAYLENQGEDYIWSWSKDGLSTSISNDIDSPVICYSTHLTSFAIILGSKLPPSRVLQVISIIGLALSIVGLTLTILAQILFRKLRKGRSQMVLLHLALALLAVDIIILADVRPIKEHCLDQVSNYVGCRLVAALLHYFLLVSFLWMLVEAVIQYLKFVKVFDTYTPRFMLKAALPAWLIPAVIVIPVAAVDNNLIQGREFYCWLKPVAFRYAFLLPLGLIMVTNLVLFILVIKGITCDRAKGLRSNQSKNKMVLLEVQAAIACFVLMGLTWVFAFFALDDIDNSATITVMQFLFCIFNSLQGFFIFIFLSIRERPVREAWVGLFGLIKSKATLSNLRIKGTTTTRHKSKQMIELESESDTSLWARISSESIKT